MTDTVQNLVLDLVEWVARQERSYQETMDAWRTSCPRLPVWEEATEHGFVESVFTDRGWLVLVTPAGLTLLEARRSGTRARNEILRSPGGEPPGS